MSDSDNAGRKVMEAEWTDARAEELIRRNWERRKLVEAGQRVARRTDAQQEANTLFKKASVCDGLGNAQAALKHYREFLEAHGAKDEISAFVRERIEALSHNQ